MFTFKTIASAVALLAPVATVVATPLPWDGGSAMSGPTGNVNGGGVTGGGGINLIKLLSHNAGGAGLTQSGPAEGGAGGDRYTDRRKARSPSPDKSPSGSAGGPSFSGAAGSAQGGSAQTDPGLTILDVLSDNGADGGKSLSGAALGGAAGNILPL